MDLLSDLPPETGAAPVPVVETTSPKKKAKTEDVFEFAMPVRKATKEQVENLVALFFPEAWVKEWSYERAALRLTQLRNQADWAANRAKSIAAQVNPNEACPFPPFPHWLADINRNDAATAIEEAAGDLDQLYMAVAGAVSCLEEVELRRLAKHFVTKFKPQELEAVR